MTRDSREAMEEPMNGRLGIDISARSREGAGTQIILEFPVSSYLSKL